MAHKEWFDVDGNRIPSVTEVTSLYTDVGLQRWRGAVGNEKADKVMHDAATIGTRMHEMIEESIDRGQTVWCSEDDLSGHLAMRAFEWYKETGIHVLHQELGMQNDVEHYGGTADLIGVLDNVPVVVDWKSSSRVNDKMMLQLAAYARSWNLRNKLTWEAGINVGIIIRPRKESPEKPVQIKVYDKLEAAFEVFKGMRLLWDFVNKQGTWRKSNGGKSK